MAERFERSKIDVRPMEIWMYSVIIGVTDGPPMLVFYDGECAWQSLDYAKGLELFVQGDLENGGISTGTNIVRWRVHDGIRKSPQSTPYIISYDGEI